MNKHKCQRCGQENKQVFLDPRAKWQVLCDDCTIELSQMRLKYWRNPIRRWMYQLGKELIKHSKLDYGYNMINLDIK